MNQLREGAPPVDYAAIGTTVMVPPMGDAARQLIALSDDDGFDSRVLALIARDDPIHLARLLAMANASSRGLSRPARTADEAIQIIGTRDARAAMLALALAASFVPLASAAPLRPWLLTHSVGLALAARRVASVLDLSPQRASHLQMAALFDPLGVHAALGMSPALRAGLMASVLGGSGGGSGGGTQVVSRAWPHDLPVLDGYWQLSAIIARRWRAPREVAEIIESRWSLDEGAQDVGDGSLLWLSHDLLARKLEGPVDIESLLAQPNPLDSESKALLAARGPQELEFPLAG